MDSLVKTTTLQRSYSPEPLGLSEVRKLLPKHVFKRDSVRSSMYFARDVAMAVSLACAVSALDSALKRLPYNESIDYATAVDMARWMIWLLYWWFQGLIFTGIWVIGHECGHGAFSSSTLLSDAVGFICHTALWTPYFSWKFSHQSHHRHHASMDKDEHWIPQTRTEFMAGTGDLEESDGWFSDTPIVTAFRLVVQQVLGLPAYLIMNTSGQSKFPRGTSHFNPFSAALFRPHQRKYVFLSDMGILVTTVILVVCVREFGLRNVWKFYGAPCVAVAHWVTMIVFLQHTDPRLPHFRSSAWSFTRGALSTMDRDFLGWQGCFFLHNIAHFHTVHHLFPTIPFYHTEEATAIVKIAFGKEYQSSSEPVFESLWRNFELCQFVEDEGEVLYYKDRSGKAHMVE